MCDGYAELSSNSLDGYETDETECDYFPCNNIYTRCDGYWNCPDGADELNCEWPPMCPLMHHMCLSPITGNFTCLHIDRVNDGVDDCLGSTDEQFCRGKCPSSDFISDDIVINNLLHMMVITNDNLLLKDKEMVWYCDRGMVIRRSTNNSNNSKLVCLCPPGYYGPLCQYQNQRVSLTVQLKVFSDWNTVFTVVMTLRDVQQGLIESYEQFSYSPLHDCSKKFNFHLLYATRPKNTSTNHTVRIDIYTTQTLELYASWSFPIVFAFLPVYLMPVQLKLPTKRTDTQVCDRLTCGIHGRCLQYVNQNVSFCHCHKEWTGLYCDIPYICNCSSDALCLGPNICLCPLEKFGPRCYLKYSTCPCENGGVCMRNVKHVSQENDFHCVCPKSYHGLRCEHGTKIVISFSSDLKIPLSIRVHLIEVLGILAPHTRTSILQKIPLDQDTVTIVRSKPFHIVFIEIGNRTYYLTVVQQEFTLNTTVSSAVATSNRCPFINEIFNASFVEWHLLRRMKYYHIPCQKQNNLACFYDESQMCICNHDLKQANCFTFNHSMIDNCNGQRHPCENNGSCYQNDPKCSTPFICVCDECSYGSRCQFSTKNFFLSLDIILGNQIRTFVSFAEQHLSIKVITGIVTFMLVCGLTSSILCILTFQAKKVRAVACGYYLLTSSCISAIVMIIFALKFYFLIVTQMGLITNRTYLSFNCKLMDFLVKILVNTSDWLNAFVGIDRAITATKDTKSNSVKSKRTAKWIIICICIFTILTHIQDPIYRRLIYDEEDNRLWCILEFSPSLRFFNSTMLFLHFLLPFIINIISAFIIIFNVARHRSIAQKQQPYKQHLREQFYKFKHLLISPIALIILALPQLIISFMSRCMKSLRNPWFFLAGYLMSFVPPILIFIIFVLTSKTYVDEFNETIKYIKRRMHRQ